MNCTLHQKGNKFKDEVNDDRSFTSSSILKLFYPDKENYIFSAL